MDDSSLWGKGGGRSGTVGSKIRDEDTQTDKDYEFLDFLPLCMRSILNLLSDSNFTVNRRLTRYLCRGCFSVQKKNINSCVTKILSISFCILYLIFTLKPFLLVSTFSV